MTSRTRAPVGGFTLLEIILVVAISLIVSAVAVPSFLRSYQAAHLRTASRHVVTAGKYARNMAVLQQRQMTVFFNTHNGQVDIVALDGPGGVQAGGFLDGRHGLRRGDEDFSPTVLRSVQLPERARIVDFHAPSRDQEMDGVYWVNYFPSGVSDSFTLRLRDDQGRQGVWIEFDHLSGKVTTRYE